MTERQTTEQAVTTEDAAGILLETVRQLAAESHVHSGENIFATLDSSLERDLGFDSLGRVELLARLERVFGISLPEQVLANAETPRDLPQAVLTATPVTAPLKGMQRGEAPVRIQAEPSDALTLPEFPTRHCGKAPWRSHRDCWNMGCSPDSPWRSCCRPAATISSASSGRCWRVEYPCQFIRLLASHRSRITCVGMLAFCPTHLPQSSLRCRRRSLWRDCSRRRWRHCAQLPLWPNCPFPGKRQSILSRPGRLRCCSILPAVPPTRRVLS